MAIKSMNGVRGWSCYQAYVSFMYYIHLAKTYRSAEFTEKEDMIEHFKSLDDTEKTRVFFEIMSVNPVGENDMIKLIGVHALPNGGSVTASSAVNFSLSQLSEMVIESLLECSKQSESLFF